MQLRSTCVKVGLAGLMSASVLLAGAATDVFEGVGPASAAPVVTITSLSPSSVPAQSEASVEIKVTNVYLLTEVLFGNVVVGATSVSATSIVAIVPPAPPGTVSVTLVYRTITDTGIVEQVTEPTAFTYLPTPVIPASGYDMVGSDGGVFVLPTGNASGFFGSLPGIGVHVNNIVGMVPTVSDQGYFLVGSDGGVFSFGDAPFLGSLPGKNVKPTVPITGIVAVNTDKGYLLVGKDGGVFAFGTVPFLGSLPGRGISVNDVIGIAATPSGDGYWVVTSTGTVYGFGAAQALGTAKGTTSPVSAIAGTPTGTGYWITTQDGSVDPFGTATTFGTLPTRTTSPSLPIIGVVPTADTGGYWLIGSDGGIFAFGDAGFVGSLPGLGVHVSNIVGAVPTSS